MSKIKKPLKVPHLQQIEIFSLSFQYWEREKL